ncbi:MAG: FtsX-like permease family protein [Planctomycetota bacterium]
MRLLPLGYVLRNLLRRRARSLVTIAGIAATTMLVIAMQSFAAGMTKAGKGSARDDVVLLLGVASEVDLVRSVVPRGSAEAAAAAVPGVLTVDGQRAASVELHIATRSGDQVGLLRGVTPAAYLVHERVTVVAGREPREPFELMVGTLAAARMGLPDEAMQPGKVIELERREFRIVGRFAAPGTVYEAEMWGRLPDIMLATKREDVSCVVLRLADPENLADVRLFAGRRLDLEIVAVPEPEMMQALTSSLEPIAALARWMAVLAVIAGAFACANTMFAAVLARTRELATLRSLGWSPAALACSLVQEAAFVAFAGGAVGILAALLVGDVSLRYPMGALRLEPDLPSRLAGLLAALASGLLGGIVPAVRAVRIPLLEAIGGRA